MNRYWTILYYGVSCHSRHYGIFTVCDGFSVPPISATLPCKSLSLSHTHTHITHCYRFKSYFFVFGQTIPTIRGAGIYQPGIDYSIDKLEKGGWIHIYPESKVVQENKMIRFKWGIGRILMDCALEPIVVPVWHKGMHLAKPLYGTKLLHLGKPIVLVFGEPVYYRDILDEYKAGKLTREETRIKLTQRMYDAVEALKKEE